jgi:preprotein translocase subunit YajC
MVFMYGAIFAIFYFVLIRPQQKQRKSHEERVKTLKKGDEIVTAGGIVGEVLHIASQGKDGAAFRFDGEDAFGRFAVIPLPAKEKVERVGFIVRKGGPCASSPITPPLYILPCSMRWCAPIMSIPPMTATP